MGGPDVGEGPQERRLDPGMLRLEPLEKYLHLLALERVVTAGGTGAADDREADLGDKAHDLVLPDVAQGPDHGIPAVARPQDRGHRADLAIEELAHQERLEQVVGVVAQRDLVATEIGGDAIEDTAPEPGAHGAV